jgi:hydrogenase expression/formation protein HypC
MCLGYPGLILAVDEQTALIDFWGVQRSVRLDDIVERVAPGDYIIIHRDNAVRRIPSSEILETLSLYETVLPETGQDPLTCELVYAIEES